MASLLWMVAECHASLCTCQQATDNMSKQITLFKEACFGDKAVDSSTQADLVAAIQSADLLGCILEHWSLLPLDVTKEHLRRPESPMDRVTRCAWPCACPSLFTFLCSSLWSSFLVSFFVQTDAWEYH